MTPNQAAGLNVVDVYVPWNLHEPRRGDFDFGEGSSQFSPFLNITRFLQLVKEEDLLAILRSSSDQGWKAKVVLDKVKVYFVAGRVRTFVLSGNLEGSHHGSYTETLHS